MTHPSAVGASRKRPGRDTAPDREPLATPAQVAKFLNRSEKTLEAWRARKFGPRFIRMGPKGVGYRWSDVDQWIKDNTIESEAVA